MVPLDQLLQMFVGKNVRVSHPTVPTGTSTGVCRDVLQVDINYFIICLANDRRFSVMTEDVDESSVEGRINATVLSRRKIEVISSVAEEAGMPFEERRVKASELLHQWALFHSIPDEDEGRKEERSQCKNKIFVALSDPLQIGLDKLLVSPALFEDFRQLVRDMYGDDATDIAESHLAAARSAAAQYAARMTNEGSF